MLASIIPTRVHGILDYLVGLLLIAAPWLFGFADIRPAMMVAVVMGVGVIIYSLITSYELGLVHLLPMTAHLVIDVLGGLFLLASPWLFGFADRIAWPHVTVGIIEIVVVLISSRVPMQTRTSAINDSGNIGRPHTA